MDYGRLCQKREQLNQLCEQLPQEALQSFDRSFDIEYTHNSTAIEGNTLSLIQTKAVLEDGISVGGKTLREIYEVVNHNKAFLFYRNVEVRTSGAKHKPPVPGKMYQQIKNFYADMPYKAKENAIELAAWTHAEFVKIHPFVDDHVIIRTKLEKPSKIKGLALI